MNNTRVRLVMVIVLVVVAVVGLLQLSAPCSGWRAWKASKEVGRFQTLELFTRPFYCVDF